MEPLYLVGGMVSLAQRLREFPWDFETQGDIRRIGDHLTQVTALTRELEALGCPFSLGQFRMYFLERIQERLSYNPDKRRWIDEDSNEYSAYETISQATADLITYWLECH